ncbi:hypothetical protein MKW98_021413 [Papaver atlanticum]|uniref:Uncharacterized protein n=1 Tax=Papaver atlanticum TaxID=357466 RepID=A0AAD4SRV3_9MAGN|nr:hypothetical protein MKW98_021413 [Papaver atlanticum]
MYEDYTRLLGDMDDLCKEASSMAAEKEFEKSLVAFLYDCSVREWKAVGNFEPGDNDAISTLPFVVSSHLCNHRPS